MATSSNFVYTSVAFFFFSSSKFLSVMETGSRIGTQKMAVYMQMQKAADRTGIRRNRTKAINEIICNKQRKNMMHYLQEMG